MQWQNNSTCHSTQLNPSHVLENATQPNPTYGWTQPMSISALPSSLTPCLPLPLFTLSFCHLHYRSFILEAQKCSKESCKIDQRTTTKLDREKAVCTCSTSPKSRIFFIMFKSISRRCQILNATFPPFPSCVLFTAFFHCWASTVPAPVSVSYELSFFRPTCRWQ